MSSVFDFTHCDEDVYRGSSFLRAVTLRCAAHVQYKYPPLVIGACHAWDDRYHNLEIIRKYQQMFSAVERMGLDGVWEMAPLFDVRNTLCDNDLQLI